MIRKISVHKTNAGIRLTLTDPRGFGRFFDLDVSEVRDVVEKLSEYIEEDHTP